MWISEVFRRGRTLRVHLEKDKMLCMQSDDVVRDTTLVQRRVGVYLTWYGVDYPSSKNLLGRVLATIFLV